VSSKVNIVGTGLLGTSLGLALSRLGETPGLADQSKGNLRLAMEYGAGGGEYSDPELVVVCVPPDMTADVVAAQLAKHPSAIVTDVASVKSEIAQRVAELAGSEAQRYVGLHPMAGRERGGPGHARADLFFARPWVITPSAENPQVAVELVRDLGLKIGALPVSMTAEEHDAAVALVSHLPQLVASALAARLLDGKEEQLALTGQGLRDTARVAASDPDLWLQILSQNAELIAPLLAGLKEDVEQLQQSFEQIAERGALAKIHAILDRGNRGISRIPGKHGGKYVDFAQLTVVIDDSPGALASLVTFIGDIGVNIEDLKLEHSPGAQIGLVEIQVIPASAEHLTKMLTENGWRIV
jgi:prephenate dehydrogenase